MALKVTEADARRLVRSDLNELAPCMRAVVNAALEHCQRVGVSVKVYEALRTDQLAQMYFQLHASKATNGLSTWHYYGLAVDIIHPLHGWDWWDSHTSDATEWRDSVVEIFKSHGMKWGGDWTTFVDRPHFQWAECPASPPLAAKDLIRTKGRPAVWALYHADQAPGAPRPLLRLGDRGAEVKLVQARLSVEPVSGLFGPITRDAVVAFQKAHALEADGIVGKETWKALGI